MPYISLVNHFVWATWDRLDLIQPSWEGALFAQIRRDCARLEATVLALNGTENHVHLLVGLKATAAPALFVGEIKGSSSFVVNEKRWFDGYFKWQGEYAAHSVSRWDTNRIQSYIDRQKEHHTAGTAIARLELPPLQLMRGNA